MPPGWTCPRGHHGEVSPHEPPPSLCPVCGVPCEIPTVSPLQQTMPYPAPDGLLALAGSAECVRIPGYEILAELGRGGMGVVYKAKQLKLNRVVALKMILAGEHAGPQDLQRFRVEAESVAQLQHPNIVQIHDVGESDGRAFFSLEFIDGGSLAQRLAESRPSPEAAA